jgi:predicted dehydrogenase
VTVGIGVLGLASFYGPAYAERASDHPSCVVVAAVPGDATDVQRRTLGRPTADAFAAEHDCAVYERPEDLLADDRTDAVVVATRSQRRAEDACAALERGCPVLTAKPAAADPDEAEAVASAAANTGHPAVTTSPARFDDAVAELGRRVRDGAVGDVVSVRAAIRHDRVPESGIEYNAEHAPDEAGSAYSMGFYTADALLWLSDSSPVGVSGTLSNVNTPYSSHPDLGSATVRFEDGAVGTMTMTYATDCRDPLGNWEVEVVGTDGTLRTTHQGYEGMHWRGGDPDERRAEVFGRTQTSILDRQFDAFVRAVTENADPAEVQPSPAEITDAISLCAAWEAADESDSVVLL